MKIQVMIHASGNISALMIWESSYKVILKDIEWASAFKKLNEYREEKIEIIIEAEGV